MVIKLTPDAYTRISTAIAAAETRTSGEIFCVLARRVSSYRDVSLAWAAAAALILPLGLIPLGFEPAWIPGVADGWQAAHLAATDAMVGHALAAYAVIQAVIFLVVYLLARLPGVLHLITPRSVRRARVRKAALQQFLAHGLHVTQERTGVLIFAALADHQVEVIADEGIHAKVDQSTWADVVDAMTQHLKQGDPSGGFEAAVELCATVLAAHFPPKAANPDEVENKLVVI